MAQAPLLAPSGVGSIAVPGYAVSLPTISPARQIASAVTAISDAWANATLDAEAGRVRQSEQARGVAAGIDAALGGEGSPLSTGGGAIARAAYDRGATYGYATGASLVARKRLGALAGQFARDPQGFASAAERERQSLLDALPPELAAPATAEWLGVQLAYEEKVGAARMAADARTAEFAGLADLSVRRTELMTAMRRNNLDVVDRDWPAYQAKIAAMVDAGMRTPEQASADLAGAQAELSQQGILHHFDRARDEGLTQARAFAEWVRTTPDVDLDPDQREKLYDQMVGDLRADLSDREQSDRMRDRAADLRREAAVKDLADLRQQGKLTLRDLDARRGDLSATEYRQFREKLTPDRAPAQTDPAVYSELLTTDPLDPDYRNDVLAAHRAGQLTDDRLTQLLRRPDDEREARYRPARETLKTAMGYSDFNPLSGGALERYVQAKSDHDDWLARRGAEGKPATADEALRYSRLLAAQYRLTAVSDVAIPVPRTLVGTRDVPDVAGTEAELVRLLDAGRINRDEFAQELTALRQLKDYLDRQADLRRAMEGAPK